MLSEGMLKASKTKGLTKPKTNATATKTVTSSSVKPPRHLFRHRSRSRSRRSSRRLFGASSSQRNPSRRRSLDVFAEFSAPRRARNLTRLSRCLQRRAKNLARLSRRLFRRSRSRSRRSSRRLFKTSSSQENSSRRRSSGTSKNPDARRRPKDHKRLALDILERYGPEKARVAGVGPVVAHHEDAAFGYRYRPKRAAIGERFVGVALVPALVVHVEPVVTDADFVSW